VEPEDAASTLDKQEKAGLVKKISFDTEKYVKIPRRMGMKRVGTCQQPAAPAVRSDAEGGFFNFAVRKSITNGASSQIPCPLSCYP
jgi:hypothetical protein